MVGECVCSDDDTVICLPGKRKQINLSVGSKCCVGDSGRRTTSHVSFSQMNSSVKAASLGLTQIPTSVHCALVMSRARTSVLPTARKDIRATRVHSGKHLPSGKLLVSALTRPGGAGPEHTNGKCREDSSYCLSFLGS